MPSTGLQPSCRSANTLRSSSWITRISVGVNSRPSILVGRRPSPPKKLSTTVNTRRGSNTHSAVPRNGLTRIRLRLVGTNSECVYSENFMVRSEEHTSELQSLMRISYAVFCLKKKKNKQQLDKR